MCTDFGPDRLRFAGLIPERVQKSEYNIGFQPTMILLTSKSIMELNFIAHAVVLFTA